MANIILKYSGAMYILTIYWFLKFEVSLKMGMINDMQPCKF